LEDFKQVKLNNQPLIHPRRTNFMLPQTRRLIQLLIVTLLFFVLAPSGQAHPLADPPFPNNPIMFVTQVPVPADFTTIGSTFGNHQGSLNSAARGGDLWIRYPNGTLKNLTAAAGYGSSGFLTGNEAIAVRDPAVSWDGTKAIFSMVIGAPTAQYDYQPYYWQLYEVTGFQNLGDTVVITKVPHQPQNNNNVSPVYAPNGRILFISDRPRNGQSHLYPQLDEYEEAPTNTGVWSMDATIAGGDLKLLDHAPSGDFDPLVDSFGRVVFTRWDHLQRDQQADADNVPGPDTYGTFNYADESATAAILNSRAELFPEPRQDNGNLNGHTFNHFFPWQINPDGTELETLNHVGRHELHSNYLGNTFNDDPNLVYYADPAGHSNQNFIVNGDGGLFHLQEDPTQAGLYYATHAREFGSHSAGQLVTLMGAPSLNADQMEITYLTHPATLNTTPTPGPFHSGLYRDPLPLSNGTLIAAHTAETRQDSNVGSGSAPQSRYDFRLKTLTTTVTANGTYWVADQALTSGITKTVSYWSPDVLLTYSGLLWELNPVEVRARPIPATPAYPLPGPEQQIFNQVGVDPAALKNYLIQNNLALAVSRNVTTRDDLDRQQPFNLKIKGSSTQTIGAPGKLYEVAYMQFFQADQLRGLTFGGPQPRPGRRVLAQPMHDPAVNNPPTCAAPPGSTQLAADGSMAAFVPARRAMTWQLTDSSGNGIVRERFWVTFQPGEIRVCASCHGLNEKDQAGQGAPNNPPEALRQLLQYWQNNQSNTTPCNLLYLPAIRH
jgi:hypothetical protein